MKIYLDMDGVLADYRSKFLPLNKEKIDESDIRNGFFMTLPVLDGARELVQYCHSLGFGIDIEVLTSIGTKLPSIVLKQKKFWLDRHFHKNLSDNMNYVHHSKEKAYYANSNTILIDDREKSIIPFREAGGVGILYSGFTEDFKKLLDTKFEKLVILNLLK